MYPPLFLFFALLKTVVAYHGLSYTPSRPRASDMEMNDGFIPSTRFDAEEQYVDTTGIHRFIAPGRKDIRGPCPALNAAANHGYTSRSGVLNFQDTISVAKLYGGDTSLFLILFEIALGVAGSFIDEKFSIGGPVKSPFGGLLGEARGLSNTHTEFEGDGSPSRADTFLKDGDSHTLSLSMYAKMLSSIGTNDNYDMPTMRAHLKYAHDHSIRNNPLAFFGAFSFSWVPVVHTFIPAFFSNHSKENIGGVLPRHVLNSFFAVKENPDGTLDRQRGQERIPKDWYRRSSSNPYGLAGIGSDLSYTYNQNPSISKIGGNLGKADTFTEIPLDKLTSDVYRPGDLLEAGNALCFMFQITKCYTYPTPPCNGPPCSFVVPCSSKFPPDAKCRTMTSGQYRPELYRKFPGFSTKPPLQPARPY